MPITTPTLTGIPDWEPLVVGIKARDPEAVESLWSTFHRGVQFMLCRRLGSQDLEDRVNETFLLVIKAIERAKFDNPQCLPGFIRTIIGRQIATYIGEIAERRHREHGLPPGQAFRDKRENPEQLMISRERIEFMHQVLAEVSAKDRAVLTRFYLEEQPMEQICEEMGLTDTQFRLLKSRAKDRFGELGRHAIHRQALIKSVQRN